MKLALVHDWLTGMRGGEKCLAVLCRRFPKARLFSLIHRRGSLAPEIERMRITTSFLQRVPLIARHYRGWLPLMPRAIESLRIPSDIDLVVSFSHAVAKSVRVDPGIPHISYCFTPMRYAWHMRHEYRRADHAAKSLLVRGARRMTNAAQDLLLNRLRRWDRSTSDRVTQFVAISRTVQRRIADCYGRESSIIYPPVDTDFYTPDGGTRSDYYLVVSALVPYKRIDLAIAACRQLGRRLVVIGSGPEAHRLARCAAGGAQFLGWRPDHEVREHLRRCRALLFPGQEDFGIVPVEAQACGTPVVAYGQGGATETIIPPGGAEPGTGVFFDEPNADSLKRAILYLESNPGAFSASLARQQALRFSASRYERELVDLVNRVADGHSSPTRRAA